MSKKYPQVPANSKQKSCSPINVRIDGMEPVLYLSNMEYWSPATVNQWMKIFAAVNIAAPAGRPDGLPDTIRWHQYTREDYRSTVWNEMLTRVTSRWVLFLEDDEMIHLSGIPTVQDLELHAWMPALVQWKEKEMMRQCYHIRLVANTGKPLFQGKHLPDCTAYMTSHDIKAGEKPVYIYRDTNPYSYLVPEDELSVAKPSPQVYLAMGAQYFDEGRYVHAAAQYRKLLKSTDVLMYDWLAAKNGLTSCLAEQYKWAQAVEMAVSSIKDEPRQRLPYLILYRIHQLGKRWADAYEILEKYYGLKDELSRANYDKVLSEKDTLIQLADMAFRAGLRAESFHWYKKLYIMQGGDVHPEISQRLLLFAIELGDYEQSVVYFGEIFSDVIPDKLDAPFEEMLFEFLALFMKQGWYEFAATQYQRLLEHQPSNEAYMRRWLAALSKSKDIVTARKVVAKLRARKKAG